MSFTLSKRYLLVVLAVILLGFALAVSALPRFLNSPPAAEPPGASQATPMRGDLDGDADVDQNDLNIVLAGRNSKAIGPNDPRDLNKDGKIDGLDARALTTLCVLPRCESIPPDPGDAGKQTLEGIDSDQNGVRDDIQRYIVFTYKDSEKMRAALTQTARGFHQALTNSQDKQTSLNNMNGLMRSQDCLIYIRDVRQGISILRELKARFLNTDLRSDSWIKASAQIGGQTFQLTDESDLKSGCDFDPDMLRN